MLRASLAPPKIAASELHLGVAQRGVGSRLQKFQYKYIRSNDSRSRSECCLQIGVVQLGTQLDGFLAKNGS